MPPSVDALHERLRKRGTDSPEKIEKRLAKAGREIEFAPKFDYVVLNDDLDTAVDVTEKLVGDFLSKE